MTLTHAVGIIVAIAWAVGAGQPPGADRASQSASAPASQPRVVERVRKLVADLGSADYRTRARAQAELETLDESASVHLIEFINHPDPEIASRVAAAIKTPKAPAARVELACRMIATTNPDWMERGTHMLFDADLDAYDLFAARTAEARGMLRVVYEPVAEELKRWRNQQRLFERNLQRLIDKGVAEDRIDRLRTMHAEGALYHAEAAYWAAHDALLDHSGRTDTTPAERHASTKPAGTPSSGPSG